jgi:hypothetical protein
MAACFQDGERPSAHCAMAAIFEDRRSSVSGQRWPRISGIGSLLPPRKSALCFQTEEGAPAWNAPLRVNREMPDLFAVSRPFIVYN